MILDLVLTSIYIILGPFSHVINVHNLLILVTKVFKSHNPLSCQL